MHDGNNIINNDLDKEIRTNPQHWCGEQRLDASVVPVRRSGVLERSAWSVRAFLIRDEEGIHVLPGGLARVSQRADDLHSGTRLGGGTKDCWILGADGEAVPKMPRMPRRPGGPGTRRVARTSRRLDDLFWMARRAERLSASPAACAVPSMPKNVS